MHLFDALEKNSRTWLGLILIFGLVLRVTAVTVVETPRLTLPEHVAYNIAQGEGFTVCKKRYFPFCGKNNNHTASVAPVPTLTFAGAMILFGDKAHAATVALNILLDVLTAGLIYVITARLFQNKSSALLGALLYSTYLPMVRLTPVLISEPIFAFFVSLSLLLLVSGLSTGRHTNWLLAGITLGLATMSRLPLVYFPFILAVGLILVPGSPLRKRAVQTGILLVAFSITISPWVLRNELVFHTTALGGSMNGYNLYRHNHIIANENYLRYVSAKEGDPAIERLVKNRADLRGDENEFAMDRIYRQEALEIIKSHPGRYLHLSAYRWFLLFFGFEAPWQKAFGVVHVFILLLAVASVCRRRQFGTVAILVLVLLLIYYVGGHMLVNARVRFIAPIMPAAIVLAADELRRLLERLTDHFFGKSAVGRSG